MSLQSRKCQRKYNRAAHTAQLWDCMEEYNRDPLEDYEEPCNCESCNPSLGMIRKNQLMVILWKLRVIRGELHDYFIW